MSTKPPADSGKVSRVRPIQRTSATRPQTSAPSTARVTGVESTRHKQQMTDQLQQIRDLELQVSTLQKKNVELQREMHEAMGLQQIKSKAVEALHKDLHSKSDLERRVNDFLAAVSNETLDAVAEELLVLRKKCSRSEEYLAELNERYRNAELRNKKLSDAVAELKAEMADQPERGQPKKGDKSEELKNLLKRNIEMEQKCEAMLEYKERLVKVEIEKRDLKAENTQLRGKLTTLQREKKQIQDRLTAVEGESSQKLKEMKDAQVRHLEMLSKLRRSHTKLDAKYKHLLKERAQWQSLFRTANGELSRSTESLASISSVASTSVSRTSFFRDSSNLEEYNIHLESELVAVQESLKISDKEKERLDRKLKTLAEQVVEDENLIAELDLNRSQLVEERDSLAQKCASSEEQIVVLQRTVDELRDRLDTVLFENNEMSMREDDSRRQRQQPELLAPTERQSVFESQAKTAESLRVFYDNILKETKSAVDKKLDVLESKLKAATTACEMLRSNSSNERAELQRQRLVNAEHERRIEVLKNNAESLAKDLSVEVRDRSNTEVMKLQDEVNARDAKLKDYEKMQKVLKKALVENEKLKNGENLLFAKIGAAEARVVELESQLRSEQQLVTESNGKLTQRLRQAEKENDRLQAEFAALKTQISELSSARDALESAKHDREAHENELSARGSRISELEREVQRLSDQCEEASQENKSNVDKLSDNSARIEALSMTLKEKAQQIASLIRDLEGARGAKASLEKTVTELRDECQRHVDDKDSKLASLAEDMRNANRELNDVLRDKARRIEELESQVRKASEAQSELDKSQTKALELEKVVEDSLEKCRSFVAALEIPVKPGLELGEFVSRMSRTIEMKWAEKNDELRTKDDELRLAQAQNLILNRTIEELTEKIEKDEHSLKRYEEVLSENMEKMERERKQLEDGMKDLQTRDTETIKELRKNVADLELELEQAKQIVRKLSSSETRCTELETQLEAIRNQEDSSVKLLQEQLQSRTRELEESNSRLEAIPIIEGRLNITLAELNECHGRIDILSKGIAEREEKIRGKNQVIKELETELSERIATFDEMAKVFTLKGDEYKKVREGLSTSEQQLSSLSARYASLKTILVEISQTLLPDLKIETDPDWDSVRTRALEATEGLKEAASRSCSLEKELMVLQTRTDELSRASHSQEARLTENIHLIESLERDLGNRKEALEKAEAELAQALDSLGVVKADHSELERISRETQASHVAEVSNLRKLLVESESMMCGLSEQRNIELANLMEKIHCLAKENEQLESRVKEESDAHRVELAELSSSLRDSKELLGALEQEKANLENELNRTQSELDATKADYDLKASELEELTKILATKQSDMTRFEEKLHALKDRYGEKLLSLQKNLTAVQAEKASLVNTVPVLEQSLRQNQAEKEQLLCQVTQLETQVIGLENREAELESSLKDKCESLEALRHEMDILEQKTHEACSQYDETERKLTEREAEVSRLVDDLANAKTELSERCEDVNSYHDHVKALAEEKVRHEEEVNALKKKINDNSDEYQAEALEMQHELSIMTERYNIKCHECEELNKDVAIKNAEIQSLSERVGSLTADNQRTKDSLNETQKQLEIKISERDLASKTTRQLEFEKAQMEQTLRVTLQQKAALEAATTRNAIESDRLCRLVEEEQTARTLSERRAEDLQAQLDRKSEQLSHLEESSSATRRELEARLETSRKKFDSAIEDKDRAIAESNERYDHLKLSSAQNAEDLKYARERLVREELAHSATKKQEERIRAELEAKLVEFDEFKRAADLCRNELKLELVTAKTKLQRSVEQGQQIGIQSEKELHTVQGRLDEEREVAAQKDRQVELLKRVSDDLQLKCSQLQLQLASNDELAQTTLDDNFKANQQLQKDLASIHEALEEQKSITAQGETEANELKERLTDAESRKLALENQIQSLSTRLEEKATRLSELEKSSESSCHGLKLELVTTQKKLCQALEDSEEQLNHSELIVKSLRKEVTDQKLAVSQRQEEVIRLRKHLEHVESAHLTSKKQFEESALALDSRTAELAELKKLSDVSLNELKLELATAQKKLSSTIEEDAAIRNRLESELKSLRKQLSDQELAMSQLGGGVLKIRDELNGHKGDLSKLREAVVEHQNELSALLVDMTEKLGAASRHNHAADSDNESRRGSNRSQNRLVDRCLETLKQHHVLSLAGIQHSANGENRRAPESLDTLDVHFQTFNGPTAQFVAEQQASSTAMMKKLAAAMERDDTAPDQHDPHLSNGDITTAIKVDPFDTIKQQKILIHELMAKLEMTKKVLDGEVSRRRELDERFKSWSTDTRLHNAQVSFNIAQMNQRDDTFDSAPIMDSQKQLIPETSLHVTRQFPSYVESFIRWLVTSAPQRPGALPQK